MNYDIQERTEEVTTSDLDKLIADLEFGHPYLRLEDQQLLGHLMRWKEELMYCNLCREGEGWICEQHPDKHWPHDNDDCGGPGMPCSNGCNALEQRQN